MTGTTQILFVDTPGIFMPRRRLDRAMVSIAWQEARAADVILLIVDVTKPPDMPQTADILTYLTPKAQETILILNKIDRVHPHRLLELASWFNHYSFSATFMISALTGDGISDIYRTLIERMPIGPWLYPEDHLTDLPMRLFAAEITRESIFFRLHSELPYTSTVESEKWEELDDGSVCIHQVIYVERQSQRAIVLGKGGHSIKMIGQAARLELERCLNCRVHLKLFVKVRAHWMDDRARYQEMGLPFDV